MKNTRLEFCKKNKINRGKLSSEQSEKYLSDIYSYGIDNFLDYCITQKHLGVSNLVWIALFLKHPQQDIFIVKLWVDNIIKMA